VPEGNLFGSLLRKAAFTPKRLRSLKARGWQDQEQEPALWVAANRHRQEAKRRLDLGGVSAQDRELAQLARCTRPRFLSRIFLKPTRLISTRNIFWCRCVRHYRFSLRGRRAIRLTCPNVRFGWQSMANGNMFSRTD